jgi:hypothetical protein
MDAIFVCDGLSSNRPESAPGKALRRGGETGPAEASCAQNSPVRAHPLPFVASRPLRQAEGDGLNRRREKTS